MNITLPFGLTGTEIGTSLLQCIRSQVHIWAGFGIALYINATVHGHFKVESKTAASYAIKASAFVIATGVNLSLYAFMQKFPYLTLVTISGQKAIELFVFNMLLVHGVSLLSRRPSTTLTILTPLLGLGPIIQYTGFPGIAAATAINTAIAAWL